MKKVVLLIPYLSGYGGIETVIHNLIEQYLMNSNNDVNFKVYSIGGFLKNNCLKFSNVKIFQYPINSFLRKMLYIITLPFIIPYLILRARPDVIISTTPVMWTLAKIFEKLSLGHIPVVGWYHYSFEAKPVNKFFLKQPDYYLAISKAGAKTLINNNYSPDKIFVIYNPVLPSNKVINNSSHHNQFIYVGKPEYNNQKNVNELFKALSLLKDNNWQLRIYGISHDIGKLKSLAKVLHISQNIQWMGFVKNVFNNISIADALILCSNYEGLPMVLVEAISHGLYVISSNCNDGPSEIINNNNGDLYKLGDTQQLLLLLNNVLKGNKILDKNKMKKSISKFYINKYFYKFNKCLIYIIKEGV